MPSLESLLVDPAKKTRVVEACCQMIDAEVADKGGLTGIAVKTGYKVVQGIKPGFVRAVVNDLLPEFARALDPLFQEATAQGVPIRQHFQAKAGPMADALLAITDAKATRAQGPVKGAYDKLRGMAKKHVEAAAPRLGALLEEHAK